MKNAIQTLLQGGVIALPTETVFALAADAQNPSAVARVYALKKRPANKALSLLIADLKALDYFTQSCSSDALILMRSFWPGPLTCILPKSDQVLGEVLGESSAVALRMPAHGLALALIQQFAQIKGRPCALAAPSANISGMFSPSLPEHVRADLGEHIPILAGRCTLGIESTIVDCTQTPFQIVRSGAITLQALQKIVPHITPSIDVAQTPKKKISCCFMDAAQIHAFLKENKNKKVAILGFSQPDHAFFWAKMPLDPTLYARTLYAQLRDAEKAQSTLILLEKPPQNEEWQNLWDFFHGQFKNFLKTADD